MKHAADTKGGIAACKGAFAAFVLDAEIPALLRKGSSEALGAQLDFEEGALSLMIHGALAPLEVNATGRYISSVVEFGKGSPCSDRRPNLAASFFMWSF